MRRGILLAPAALAFAPVAAHAYFPHGVARAIVGSTLYFGSETLGGFGGTNAGAVTGRLTSVGTLVNTCGANTFMLGPDGDLVPYFTTYGAGQPLLSLAGSACQLSLTAAATTVVDTITIQANTSTVKSHYGFTNNPDTPASFQLLKVLGSATAIKLGDTIMVRDGGGTTGSTPGLNPTDDTYQSVGHDNRYSLKPPTTAYSGTGRITIQCETSSYAALDANGNTQEGGDCQMAGLGIVPNNTGPYTATIPWDFRKVTFYANTTPTPTYLISQYMLGELNSGSFSAEGVSCYDCRFELGPNVTTSAGVDLSLYGALVNGGTIDHSHFKGPFIQAITNPSGTAGVAAAQTPRVYTHNVFEQLASDVADLRMGANSPIIFTNNFGFNWLAKDGNPVPGATFSIGATSYLYVATPTDTVGAIPVSPSVAMTAFNTACTIDNGGYAYTGGGGTHACVAGVNYPATQGVADPNVTAVYAYASPVFTVKVTARTNGVGTAVSTPTPQGPYSKASYNISWGSPALSGGGPSSQATGVLSFSGAHSDFYQVTTYGTSGAHADATYGGTSGPGVDFEGNIGMRAVGEPNEDVTQNFFGNPNYGCCIMNVIVKNNIANQSAGNQLYFESYYNPTVMFNTTISDYGGSAYDPGDPSYDPLDALTYVGSISPANLTVVTGFQNFGGGTFSNNVTNTVSSLSNQSTAGYAPLGLASGTLTTSNNEALGQQATPTLDVAGYQTFLPNYPGGYLTADLNRPATNRAAALLRMTPAVGHLVTITTTASSTAATRVSDPDGALRVGLPLNGLNAMTGDQVVAISGAAITLRVAATATGTATYGTGLMNGDGTYNGALFPNGCWNDGSVYNPATACSAAQ